MKCTLLVILILLFAGTVVGGCLQNTPPGPTPVPTLRQTPEITETPTAPVPQPSFTLSDSYLKKSYTFQNETQGIVEDIRVDNASWGIKFDVTPLTDDVIYSWFEMNVTKKDNMQSVIYGYGRTNGFELHHLIPMYNTGLYEIVMKGNRVKVDVFVAKRNP